MAFDIEQFKSVHEKGFLKPSNYLIYVYPPVWAMRDGGAQKWNGPDLAYLAASAALPGVQIFTTESKVFGQGPTIKMPYDIVPTDLTLKFYADATGKSMAFFYDWLRNVVNLSHVQNEPRAGAFSNQLSYRSEYITKIDIMLFRDKPRQLNVDPQDGSLMIFSLYDVYPTAISETTLDWQSGNEIMSFNVTFAYTSFEYKLLPDPKVPLSSKISGLQGVDPQFITPVPVSLTDLGVGGLDSIKPDPLTRLNNAAKNIREKSQQIRSEAVSSLKNIENTIYNNQYITTAKEIVGTVKDIRKTLTTLKGLNSSLKKDLNQQLKTITSGVSLKGFI